MITESRKTLSDYFKVPEAIENLNNLEEFELLMHIGWIDFSKSDKDKVLSVLQLFAEKGAIDELGVGSVRDAFSNFFFPGTSTIQTRAKYFFIVSYLLQETAAEQKDLDWLWAQEHDCCHRLVDRAKKNDESLVGIIGITEVDSKNWVKRKPSSIYWNGIKTLGFFNRQYYELSIAEYLAQARLMAKRKESLKSQKRAACYNQDEDDGLDDELTLGSSFRKFWEIKPQPAWRENLRIELTQEESAFFTELLQRNYPKSVLNLLLKNWPGCALSFGAVAELVREFADDRTRQVLTYALQFDELVYSARTAYNVILSDGANGKAVSEWSEQLPHLKEIAQIDLRGIFTTLEIHKPMTLRFLENLTKLYSEDKVEFEAVKKLLISREKDLKGARAKLLRPSTQNTKWIGGGHLDYRTENVCQIIKDIKNYV